MQNLLGLLPHLLLFKGVASVQEPVYLRDHIIGDLSFFGLAGVGVSIQQTL